MIKMSEDSKEIEMIMRRKMIQYMKNQLMKQLREAEKKHRDIYDEIKIVLTDDAYKYLIHLKNTKKKIADNIVKCIVTGLYYGMLQYPIDKLLIEYLERKLEGRTGQIYVERRGETKGLEDIFRGKG